MKRAIICEGKTDAILISYFLIRKFDWIYMEGQVLGFPVDRNNEVLNWYKHPKKPNQELASYCADLPVELCLANHHGNRIEQIDDLDRILPEVHDPKVGTLIDIGHYHSSQADIPALIKKYADRIKLVHTKDQIGPKSVPFGEGEIDNLGLLKLLRHVGYDSFVVVEIEAEDKENTPKYIKEAWSYLQAILDSIEGANS